VLVRDCAVVEGDDKVANLLTVEGRLQMLEYDRSVFSET
jgi:hypothetical protein